MNHRYSPLALAILLLGAPTTLAAQAAQSSSVPGCAEVVSGIPPEADGTGSQIQLAAAERLLLPVRDLGEELLEVHFLVEGETWLVETLDLARASSTRPPVPAVKRGLLGQGSSIGDIARRREVVELLARNPDLVRDLRGWAAKGARVVLEVRIHGSVHEALALGEVDRRSAELRAGAPTFLVVPSTVEGSGRRTAPVNVLQVRTYLEDCGDCTTSTPCETECGYEPGKGGPVTCGEYGVCEPPTCPSEQILSEHWGSWYFYSSAGTGSYLCVHNRPSWDSLHEYINITYRRDLIRTTRYCPGAPSCSGCYNQQSVIDYDYGYGTCLGDTGSPCSFGYCASCGELCTIWGDSHCWSC